MPSGGPEGIFVGAPARLEPHFPSSPDELRVKPGIVAVPGHQFIMGPALGNHTVIENENLMGVTHG